MLVEESARLYCGQMVRNIDGCINPFQEDKILFHPFTKSKILDVNVSSPTSRFLRVGHSRASIIVIDSSRPRVPSYAIGRDR